MRDASSKVLVVLAGSGYCSTIEECNVRSAIQSPPHMRFSCYMCDSLLTRCTEQPELCGSPGAQILEKEGGVWSDQFSPFDSHFKVGGPSYLFSVVVNPSPGLRSILL